VRTGTAVKEDEGTDGGAGGVLTARPQAPGTVTQATRGRRGPVGGGETGEALGGKNNEDKEEEQERRNRRGGTGEEEEDTLASALPGTWTGVSESEEDCEDEDDAEGEDWPEREGHLGLELQRDREKIAVEGEGE
jgi:hypothetical protein